MGSTHGTAADGSAGMTSTEGTWKDKARALDRYRWRLLRERHTLLGAALRYGRDALVDLIFGMRARLRMPAASPSATPCDFLLLQASPKVIALRRKKLLIETLRQRGHRLEEVAIEAPREVLRQALLARPPEKVPLRYLGYAAHAQWLVERYQPRILLNDRNGSLHSPFLRLALNVRGSRLVHLAHATTVEGSRKLGMNDYDYYLIFGQSSFDALAGRALRFGSCKVVLAGSHMIDDAYDLPPATPQWRALLVLGVGPDKEKEAGYQRTYALLGEWARRHPEYRILVKRHPRSQVPFWQQLSESLPNLQVLPSDCSLSDALAQASVVANLMSNAVIEAALAGRPVVPVNLSDDRDIFSQPRFFGETVTTADELEARLQDIEQHYDDYVRHAREFVEFHLAHGSKGLENSVRILETLLRTGALDASAADVRELPGNCR